MPRYEDANFPKAKETEEYGVKNHLSQPSFILADTSKSPCALREIIGISEKDDLAAKLFEDDDRRGVP